MLVSHQTGWRVTVRAAWIGFISAMVSAGLLFAAFPWRLEYWQRTHTRAGITLESYLLVALLVGLIVAAVVVVLSHYLKMDPQGLGILTGIVSLILLIAGSVLMGPYQWEDIPGTEVYIFSQSGISRVLSARLHFRSHFWQGHWSGGTREGRKS
jgi:hypothetical protein